MKHIYVASQNLETREWIPVAELCEVEGGYALRYTRGAQRLPGFSGLGRMGDFAKIYYSRDLFPFFSNRLISKSRPEYRDYIRWLGLSDLPSSPLEILAITGGARATDNYEMITSPKLGERSITFDFFARGLRYQPAQQLSLFMTLSEGLKLYLMKDVQNAKDACALAIRTEEPCPMLIGYAPRYYCHGLARLLDQDPASVNVRVKRVNQDAPMDMKLLLTIDASVTPDFDLMAGVEDMRPLSQVDFPREVTEALFRTNLDALGPFNKG